MRANLHISVIGGIKNSATGLMRDVRICIARGSRFVNFERFQTFTILAAIESMIFIAI